MNETTLKKKTGDTGVFVATGAPSWAASRARAAAPAPTNRAACPPAGPLLIGPNEKRSGAPRIGFFRPPRERLV